MKICVLSDCHNDIKTLNKIFERAHDFDSVIFLGDGIDVLQQALRSYALPYTAVKGNNDRNIEEAFDKVLTLYGRRFFLTHGHYYDVGINKSQLAAKAKEERCEAAFFGHTHMPFYEEVDGILLINPGSTFYGRQGTKKSYGVLLLQENEFIFHFLTP